MWGNVTERHHFHACMKCGHVWDHDPPTEDTSHEEFVSMHTCNRCQSTLHCDIALENAAEAKELSECGYVTIKGRRYYADDVL